MPSSTANTFLDDPLLMAFDALPANKMLHESQVALLLGCKTRWVEEQRSRGQPSPYVMLGNRLVRYAVGPLRQWIQQTIEHAPPSRRNIAPNKRPMIWVLMSRSSEAVTASVQSTRRSLSS